MLLKTDTSNLQNTLAEYCRNAREIKLKGAIANRIPVYRRLVFGVITQTLEQAYPITHSILQKEEWADLVYDFFAQHNCQENEVWKMPRELVEFVEKSDYAQKLNRPYLAELLTFEWLEIEIHGMEDQELIPFTDEQLRLDDIPVVSPYQKTIQFEYPVFLKSEKEYIQSKGHYFISIHRDLYDFKVHFTQLNGFTASLLENVKVNQDVSIETITKFTLEQLNQPIQQSMLERSISFFNSLRKTQLILGKKK